MQRDVLSESPPQPHVYLNMNDADNINRSSSPQCSVSDTPKVQRKSSPKNTEQESTNQKLIQKLNNQLFALHHERHQNYINNKETIKDKNMVNDIAKINEKPEVNKGELNIDKESYGRALNNKSSIIEKPKK